MLHVRQIPNPSKNWKSWTLLAGILALWAFACLLVPEASGARLPGLWLPSCPLRTMTGIPCPFCGITTGCAWLAHGNIVAAWRSNILSPLLMLASLPFAAYVAGFRLVAGREIVLRLPAGVRLTVAAALAVVSWIVNLFRF